MTLVALMAMIVGFTFILANREGLEEDKVNVGLALSFTVIMSVVFGIQFFRKFSLRGSNRSGSGVKMNDDDEFAAYSGCIYDY